MKRNTTMGNETMKIQYQLSNGMWVDCEDRTEEFLVCCEEQSGLDRAALLAELQAGKTVRNHRDDWYSKCRAKPAPRPAPVVEMVKCSCGHSVPRGLVMSASLGTSCPDCYDRMSG